MHKKTAEVIFYIVLGLSAIALVAFALYCIYLALTNPN